jgi:hypothetical protein
VNLSPDARQLFLDKPVNHLDRAGWCAVFILAIMSFAFGMVAGEYTTKRDLVDARLDKCRVLASIKGKLYYNCAGEIVQLGGKR